MGSVSNARGSGVGIILISLEGLRLEKSLRLGFNASNNEAEYEALMSQYLKLFGALRASFRKVIVV